MAFVYYHVAILLVSILVIDFFVRYFIYTLKKEEAQRKALEEKERADKEREERSQKEEQERQNRKKVLS